LCRILANREVTRVAAVAANRAHSTDSGAYGAPTPTLTRLGCMNAAASASHRGPSDMKRHETFFTFFHGAGLTPLEWACMRSFVDRGHRLLVFCYQEVEVPAGVSLTSAEEILPQHELFFYRESPGAFSDIFRYALLFKFGGWWVDTDVLCLSELIPACQYAWAPEEPGALNGAILRFPRRDPKLEELRREATKRAPTMKDWGTVGPHLLTELLPKSPPCDHFGSQHDFYPLHWLQSHFPWCPEFLEETRSACSASVFLHFWNSVVQMMGIDKRLAPPRGSFMSELYRGCPPALNATEIDQRTMRVSITQFLRQGWAVEWCEKRLKIDPARLLPRDIGTHGEH